MSYLFKCDFCGGVTEAPTYGDFKCQHCGQAYVYDECHQIKLSEPQLKTLRGSRWISVSERLPPVDEKVLYTCFTEGDGPEDYFTQVNAGYWDGKARNLPGNPAMKYDDSNDWEPCSHWMPLPEPPEVK